MGSPGAVPFALFCYHLHIPDRFLLCCHPSSVSCLLASCSPSFRVCCWCLVLVFFLVLPPCMSAAAFFLLQYFFLYSVPVRECVSACLRACVLACLRASASRAPTPTLACPTLIRGAQTEATTGTEYILFIFFVCPTQYSSSSLPQHTHTRTLLLSSYLQ